MPRAKLSLRPSIQPVIPASAGRDDSLDTL